METFQRLLTSASVTWRYVLGLMAVLGRHDCDVSFLHLLRADWACTLYRSRLLVFISSRSFASRWVVFTMAMSSDGFAVEMPRRATMGRG